LSDTIRGAFDGLDVTLPSPYGDDLHHGKPPPEKTIYKVDFGKPPRAV
jgi:hypothetical protein